MLLLEIFKLIFCVPNLLLMVMVPTLILAAAAPTPDAHLAVLVPTAPLVTASAGAVTTAQLTAPRKYVVTIDDVTNSAYKLIADAGLDAARVDVDSMVMAVMERAEIPREETDRYRIENLSIAGPDGRRKHLTRCSFKFAGERYYYDRSSVTGAAADAHITWYAADIANQVLAAELAKLTPALAVVRYDDGASGTAAHRHVATLACAHRFHYGCLLTNHSYQAAAGKTPTCVACPSDKATIDLTKLVLSEKLRLRRSEAVPRCWICLEDLPACYSRWDTRFGRSAASIKPELMAAAAPKVAKRTYAAVVREGIKSE